MKIIALLPSVAYMRSLQRTYRFFRVLYGHTKGIYDFGTWPYANNGAAPNHVWFHAVTHLRTTRQVNCENRVISFLSTRPLRVSYILY
jgi:hypothetical protein